MSANKYIQLTEGSPGMKGDKGLSAYEIAVMNGFVGTIDEWMETFNKGIQGEPGEKGEKGDKGDPATNIITSVNNKTGDVVVTIEDVGAEAALGNPTEDGMELVSTVAGVRSWFKKGFVDLKDVPQSYEGQAGKIPYVNDTEDGIIFLVPTPDLTGTSLSNLKDVLFSEPLQDGQIFGYKASTGKWMNFNLPFDLTMFIPGNLMAYQNLVKLIMASDATIPANFAGAYCKVGINPVGTTPYKTLLILVNGVEIGYINISTSGVATFYIADTVNPLYLKKGDVFQICAGSTIDAYLADISISIPAYKGPTTVNPLDNEVFTYVMTTEDLASYVSSTTRAFDLMLYFPGLLKAGQVCSSTIMSKAVTFLKDFAGSKADAYEDPYASSVVFSIKLNGTEVGTMTLYDDIPYFSFASADAVVTAPGDILTIVAPAEADTSLKDVSVTLKGTYTLA